MTSRVLEWVSLHPGSSSNEVAVAMQSTPTSIAPLLRAQCELKRMTRERGMSKAKNPGKHRWIWKYSVIAGMEKPTRHPAQNKVTPEIDKGDTIADLRKAWGIPKRT